MWFVCENFDVSPKTSTSLLNLIQVIVAFEGLTKSFVHNYNVQMWVLDDKDYG